MQISRIMAQALPYRIYIYICICIYHICIYIQAHTLSNYRIKAVLMGTVEVWDTQSLSPTSARAQGLELEDQTDLPCSREDIEALRVWVPVVTNCIIGICCFAYIYIYV